MKIPARLNNLLDFYEDNQKDMKIVAWNVKEVSL